VSATVTVCVPTIGRLQYWDAVVASVERQTRAPDEILVLDNESPEASRSAIVAWAQKNPRVRVLRQAPRVPMFENFNRGLRAAQGQFVTFFHDDDDYQADFLERMSAELERSPSAGFAGSNFDFFDDDGRTVEARRWIKRTELWPGRRYIAALLGRGRNCVPMPGLMFRTAVFQGGGFDLDVPIHFGDFVILMRIAERWDVAMLDRPVVRIRLHASQASAQMSRDAVVALRTKILGAYCTEFERKHPQEAAFIGALRRRVELSHRLTMGWAVLSEPDAGVARSAARALSPDGALASPLESVLSDAVGLGLVSLRRAQPLVARGRALARRFAGPLGL
jgi:glycosyltransferase involved in cell wall biosynthesis